MQRRIAAQIMKVGLERVWFDEAELGEIAEAMTREDIRRLIHRGVIQKKQKKGVSRSRAKAVRAQKRKGRRRGHGSRKGRKFARLGSKRRWMSTIRPLRRTLRELRDKGMIDKAVYRKTYLRAKGGMFKSKSYLESYLKEHGMVGESDGA